MGFLTGNTFDQRKQHLKTILKDRKQEIKQHHLDSEIDKLNNEIAQIQQKAEQLEQRLSQITALLSNPQYETQWSRLEQEKIQIEEQLESLTIREIKDAQELLEDLQNLRLSIVKEKKIDKKAA